MMQSKQDQLEASYRQLRAQEEKDLGKCEDLRYKTAELQKQMEAMRAKLTQMAGVRTEAGRRAQELSMELIRKESEVHQLAVKEKIDEDLPMRQKELRKQKRALNQLKQQWFNIREMAKQGARSAIGGGKDADAIRTAILQLCDTALLGAGFEPGSNPRDAEDAPGFAGGALDITGGTLASTGLSSLSLSSTFVSGRVSPQASDRTHAEATLRPPRRLITDDSEGSVRSRPASPVAFGRSRPASPAEPQLPRSRPGSASPPAPLPSRGRVRGPAPLKGMGRPVRPTPPKAAGSRPAAT